MRSDQDPKDLVKETTTSASTGAITLAGAVTGFLTFASQYPEGADCYVPYTIRSANNAQWEEGIGILTGTTTLTRSANGVKAGSAGAGVLVDFAAGEKTVESFHGASAMVYGKHNRGQNLAPPPNASNGGPQYGYAFGSMYRMAHDDDVDGAYSVFLNPGASAASAALPGWCYVASGWVPVQVDTDNYDSGSIAWVFAGGALRPDARYNFYLFGGYASNVATFIQAGTYTANSYPQAEVFHVGAETSDATPTVATNEYHTSGETFFVEELSAHEVTATVVAVNSTFTVAKSWQVRYLVRRAAAGVPVLVAAADITVVDADAGAAAWNLTVASDGVDRVQYTVTGAAATTIYWHVDQRANQIKAFP